MSNEGGSGLGYIDAGLTDVQPWDGRTSSVRPGEYIVEVAKVEGGNSNAGGRKMVLHFKVVEAVGDYAEENRDQEGATIVQSSSLDFTKEGSKKRIVSLLQALIGGVDARGGFSPDELLGAQMVCEVIADSYTVTDPVTQQQTVKPTTRIVGERSVAAWEAATRDAKANVPGTNGRAAAPPQTPPPAMERGRRTTRGRANA